jgi:hypothetical protein
MKEQLQLLGIKRWHADDLLDLQAEPLKAIQLFLKPYASCALSGCEITGTTVKTITSGLVLFTWDDEGVQQSIVAEFEGADSLPETFMYYLVLDEDTIMRQYDDGLVKDIAINKTAKLSTSEPTSSPYLEISHLGPNRRFRDSIQSASYRFVTDTEKANWNGKLDASEVVTSAAANKVLKLNAASQFPATVIAQTSSYRFVTDTEKTGWNAKLNASEVVTSPAANKVLKLNAASQFPATVIAQTSSYRFVTDTEKANWNSAFGWGNHASVGYLTSIVAHQHGAADIDSGTLNDARLPATQAGKTFTSPLTVGTTSFEGHVRLSRNGNNVILASGGSSAAILFVTGNRDVTTANSLLTLTSTNRVGIMRAAPSYELDVTGTIRATSDVLADSDIRCKRDVVTINNALDIVQKLRGVSFNWKSSGEEAIGFIAQEVKDVVPQVVKVGSDGIHSVNYAVITAILVEAIKELIANRK